MKNITSPNDPWDLSFVDTAWDLSGISPSAGVVSSENTGLEPEGADTSDSWLDTFSQLESSLLASATGHKKVDTITMTQPLARKTTAALGIQGDGFGRGHRRVPRLWLRLGESDGGRRQLWRRQRQRRHGPRMNMDKRCRQLHRESFIAAIAKHRGRITRAPWKPPLQLAATLA